MTENQVSWIRNPDFIFRKIVEEMVLVPIRKNVADMDCIYTLNEVGSFLWEKLAEPQTQASLEVLVLEVFDGDPTLVGQDIQDFLTTMHEVGAVKSA